MAIISCPRCTQPVARAGFPIWVWLIAIFLFPFGLLAFLTGRKPTRCHHCGYTWVT